ncbi:MAG TPA: RtcB family protein, partial [Tepidisphaeraceae bacterium]
MSQLVDIQGAVSKVISPGGKVVRVIGNEVIRATFGEECLRQITNVADAPGIDEVVLNPDGHVGYGCPVGSAFSSREMIYPNAVGPDVKCSMSFLQFDLPADVLADQRTRRKLIHAVESRIPTGPGNHKPKKARCWDTSVLKDVVIHGATNTVCQSLGIPREWNRKCEDATHGDPEILSARLDELMKEVPYLSNKLHQLGGVGGGNHFMECNVVAVNPERQSEAEVFGLKDGKIGFLNH